MRRLCATDETDIGDVLIVNEILKVVMIYVLQPLL